MDIARRMLHALIAGLLGMALAIGIAAATIALIITNPDTIKSWPIEAGTYSKITGSIIDATSRPNDEGSGDKEADSLDKALGDSPLDKERMKKALDKVFTPDYWQGKFETLVDSFYGWLDGSRPNLEFDIVFNDKNAELADAMEAELAEQLAGYPVCSSSVSRGDFDPFASDCLPRGVSPAQAARQFADDIRKDDFLADARLSSNKIDFDEDFINNAPSTYSAMRSLPAVMGLIVVLLAAVAILTDKSRLHGLRKIGQLFFTIGLISWLGFFVGNRIGAEFQLDGGRDGSSQEVVSAVFQPLIQVAFDDFTTTGLWVSLMVVLAGTLLWLSAFIWHKVHHEQDVAPETISAPRESPKLPKPVKPNKG